MKHPEFAKRFQYAVTQSGVKDTQKALAKLFGVSEVMIWSYKNGEKLPRMAMAISIADKLNTSVEWLLQGTGTAMREPAAQYQPTLLYKTTQAIVDILEEMSESERKHVLKLVKGLQKEHKEEGKSEEDKKNEKNKEQP